VTGTVSFVVDCASFQGRPDWARVAAVCIGGAEKVTEGTSYINPEWAAAKPAMQALHGFTPLAYLFLDAVEPGAAQARYFAQAAGELTGFAIVADFERAPNGSPTLAQAQDAVAELRRLYPGTPVGGYCPHWYTGGEDLTFIDWLWASDYVDGSGDPGMLYPQVPASWWAPYGGRSPLMLQFTSSAAVAGVGGYADCSAYHGDASSFAAHVLAASSATPVLSDGAAGPAVRTAQTRLNAWGSRLTVDGDFGAMTLAAVRSFQSVRKLKVTGVIEGSTWAALLKDPPSSGTAGIPRTLAQGATGSAVRTLQVRLDTWGARLAVDGTFGLRTEIAVRSFQRQHGLHPDGIAGAATWIALLRKPPAR
jgi:GH25 family lysozyme M1 (1,4-beta-N-acetylmuramidase)